MGNEQKMRDAFEKWGTANTPERERLAFYDGWHAREALAGMNSEQKMRDAFKAAFAKAHWVDHKTYDECIDAGITAALAAPAGEQVWLTDGMVSVPLKKLALAYGLLWHVNAGLDAPELVRRPSLTPAEGAHKARHALRDMLTHAQRGDGINAALDALIAAPEVKRASCSQTAKKSTCEGGRVDETGKSEHVGGAA